MSRHAAQPRAGWLSRRRLLAAAGTVTAAAATGYLLRAEQTPNLDSPWGPLRPTVDESTGLELLRLPPDFRYLSFGWTGDRMRDGQSTPRRHDGMGVVDTTDGIATLVRNHEIDFADTFTPTPWTSTMGGGTTSLRFDLRTGTWLDSWGSLSGTSRNCAGGVTPWGTWLTCEETVADSPEQNVGHGWIFEVEAHGGGTPKPLMDMGRFIHEAAAVDPRSQAIYLTEDRPLAGLYRFLPRRPGELAAGGQLQMLGIEGHPGTALTQGIAAGLEMPVSWHPIEDPTRAHHLPGDGGGVYSQGLRAGAATFRRLEGIWIEERTLYFSSTTGGLAQRGQIWALDLDTDRLRLLAESSSVAQMDMPDNLVMGPGGDLLICEDGDQTSSRMLGLTADGALYNFAQNNNILLGHRGFFGDYRDSEWAGAAVAGEWLFVNAQKPGITYAITGPWRGA